MALWSSVSFSTMQAQMEKFLWISCCFTEGGMDLSSTEAFTVLLFPVLAWSHPWCVHGLITNISTKLSSICGWQEYSSFLFFCHISAAYVENPGRKPLKLQYTSETHAQQASDGFLWSWSNVTVVLVVCKHMVVVFPFLHLIYFLKTPTYISIYYSIF